ncbi:hypothetical protein FA95DRAFT_716005 [Auriscalpium vulgare]|uniref:Uncharacterized protein n=1 Tax=Auriscalpium vulgare TaxID=40419 RepID=A0ACB8RC97_9AGAM|nr:hypothetical protein FA95DRAFT_716005 [Auriscalpium vulgare]
MSVSCLCHPPLLADEAAMYLSHRRSKLHLVFNEAIHHQIKTPCYIRNDIRNVRDCSDTLFKYRLPCTSRFTAPHLALLRILGLGRQIPAPQQYLVHHRRILQHLVHHLRIRLRPLSKQTTQIDHRPSPIGRASAPLPSGSPVLPATANTPPNETSSGAAPQGPPS